MVNKYYVPIHQADQRVSLQNISTRTEMPNYFLFYCSKGGISIKIIKCQWDKVPRGVPGAPCRRLPVTTIVSSPPTARHGAAISIIVHK